MLKYLDFFNRRSTLRNYSTEKQVSEESLNEMLEAASHAPTTGNMQLYSVVVTRNPEMKRRLAPLHFNQPTVESASAVLTFCADFRRFEQWCRHRDAEPGYDNFHSFITALIDTVIFAQQFVTIAELNGIGCCYLGTVTYNAAGIAEVLELPERVVPVVTLTVGYPATGEFPPASDRLPVTGIIHKERYTDYTPEAIDSIYSYKESLPESAGFVAENNKSTLAQVFTDVRYPKALNEEISRTFADFIRKQGF